MKELTTAIFVSGDLYSGGDAVIDDLKSSKFNSVIAWALHINEKGDLIFNDTTIVSDGKYKGAKDWPDQLASLKKDGSVINRLTFSIGGWECPDFNHIQTLLANGGGKKGGILYRNFSELKSKIKDIDGIDYDDEGLYDADTYVDFALMLKTLGYEMVTFCPYCNIPVWVEALEKLENKAPGFVTAFNLQCYAGGAGNLYCVNDWIKAVGGVIGKEKAPGFVNPGLWSRHGDDCKEGMCPTTIETQFKEWKNLGIRGGFIWRYAQIQQCQDSSVCGGPKNTRDYAEAIINGLS